MVVHVLLKPVILVTKDQNLGKALRKLLFSLLLKILQEAMYFAPPTYAKSLTKLDLKIQDWKSVLDLTCK